MSDLTQLTDAEIDLVSGGNTYSNFASISQIAVAVNSGAVTATGGSAAGGTGGTGGVGGTGGAGTGTGTAGTGGTGGTGGVGGAGGRSFAFAFGAVAFNAARVSQSSSRS